VSTPVFLAIALVYGAGFVVLMVIVGRLLDGPLSTVYRHWLEHRLHRRLARGNDGYFEELRSIETALARPRPTQRKLGTLDYALGPLIAVIVGVQFLAWTVAEADRPTWTEHVGTSIFILLGVQWVSGSTNFSGTPTRGSRLVGVAVIAFFSFFLVRDLIRFT
jgi:hypothetical protein